MNNQKPLTIKQTKALRAIQSLQYKKQLITFKALKDELKISSDQSIKQYLDKLENLGYIKRENKKIRTTYITKKAIKEYPYSQEYIPSPIKNKVINLKIEPRQLKLKLKLAEIDPSLINIYEGILYTLNNKNNPDWIAQSAHSFRELIKIISDQKKVILTEEDKKELKKEKQSSLVKIMHKDNDPLTEILNLKNFFSETVFDELNKFHKDFVYIAHHEKISEDDYLKKVVNYELFLITYIFKNQADIYRLIDREIKKGIIRANSKTIHRLITLNLASFQYFFQKINSNWLSFVFDNNFLYPVAQTGKYLIECSKDKPKETMKIILDYEKKYIIKEKEQYYWSYFIESTLYMPSKIAIKLIDKITKDNWIQKNYRLSYWAFDMKKLIKKLLR